MLHRRFLVFAPAIILFFAACAPIAAPLAAGPVPVAIPEAPEPPPPPVAAAAPARRPLPRNVLGSARYDLPVEANSWVESELSFLVNERAWVIAKWLDAWDHYSDYVARVFADYGLPRDLQHLGMVESGYNPTARSRVGALGMWQFMPATGRGMGLRIDSMVDERMDPVRSTDAAARHLRSLHRGFGDWALAAASYNAGTGRVRGAISRSGGNSFWDLVERGYLAQETRTYVPRLYAVTIIAHDRTRWGFEPRNPAAARFAYDSIQTDLQTPLAELARIGGITTRELIRLNPHLLQASTPPGRYWAWVPEGTGRFVQDAYQASDFRRRGGFARYQVLPGEDLLTISTLADVDVDRIRVLNPEVEWNGVRAGQTLILPADAARVLAARPVPRPVPVASSTSPVTADFAPATPIGTPVRHDPAPASPAEHVVGPGDTLYSLARRYGTTVDAIRAANRLPDDAIALGRTLLIPR